MVGKFEKVQCRTLRRPRVPRLVIVIGVQAGSEVRAAHAPGLLGQLAGPALECPDLGLAEQHYQLALERAEDEVALALVEALEGHDRSTPNTRAAVIRKPEREKAAAR
jgi:hypothetical protein